MSAARQLLLEWSEHRSRTCLKISGWSDSELRELERLDAGELGRRLALFPSEALDAGGAVPPVAGSVEMERDAAWFVPRFPFVDGMSYTLLVDAGDGADASRVWTIRRLAKAAASTTRVTEIYPTASTLPFNLLRMYVQFSAPMSEGWAGSAVRVLRADTGEPLDDVFLPPEPELWDPERRRLTMLLDPGRIKRGLAPNVEFGYPLADGMDVRVMVDSKFRDAGGQPLKSAAERRYRIGPALRSRIDLGGWRLIPPPAGSMDPLSVDFGRPLDHGLLRHSLRIYDDAGNRVIGDGKACMEERGWRFTPSAPWRVGTHRLAVESRLEDVAGNSPVRVFDRDVSNPEDDPPGIENTTLDFTCVAAGGCR